MLQLRTLFMLFIAMSIVNSVLFCYIFPELYSDIEPPDNPDQYFGKGKHLTNPDDFPKDNPEVKKFEINVEDSVLEDLNKRLSNTRFVEPLDDVAFDYGFHSATLKKITDYWMNKYDWREQEKGLNKFSHFKTQIEGIDIHFVHDKPKVKAGDKVRVLPILLIHGWPGSFVEFLKMIPMLTKPMKNDDYVFEVIVPSIPGYGFSEAPHQKGFSINSAARVFVKLMDRLGFKEFYVQGGDWGGIIAINMAKLYPSRVIGVHTNVVPIHLGIIGYLKYIAGSFFPSYFMSAEEQADVYPFLIHAGFLLEESGYLHIQATKPDTVGSALADSPAGLAAYILEKFSTWTKHDNVYDIQGGLTENFVLNDLLTNVMIYWTTNTITSSMRFYKENVGDLCGGNPVTKVPVKVPSGIAIFPQELLIFPKSFLMGQMRNLIHYERMPRGGHFAAMEEPELLADQVWKFVMLVEKSGGVNP